MKNIDIKTNKDDVYAALKLIEQLYRDGRIDQIVYKKILNDYSNIVDISKFSCYNN